MKTKSNLRHFLALAGSSLLAISYTQAATTVNWEGDDLTGGAWATAGNWDTAPTNSLTAYIANFNLATYGGNPVWAPNAGTTSINGITIGASNGAMTLTTTNLSIGDGGITIANGAGAFTISGSTTLGAAQNWTNNSGNLFTFGAVTAGANLLTIGGSGNTTASGIIAGTNGALTKEGAGLLTLNAANTYTGTTTVSGGELRWGIANAINAGALTVNDGGTVNIDTFTDSVGTVTIAKGGTITGTTGALTAAGQVVSNNGGTISLGTSSTGYVQATGVIYNDTIVGSTTLNIQRINIGSSHLTFDIARGDDVSGVDVNIDIIRNGTNNGRNLIKNGTGVLQLSGSVTQDSSGFSLSNGTTTINDGTVIFNKSVDGVSGWGTGLVTIGNSTGSAASAVLQYKTSSNQIGSNAITINSDGRFDLNGFSETTSGAVTNNGSITTGAGTLTLGANTFSGASTATGNLTFTGTTITALTIGGTASINATTTFSGANNATGITATGNTSIAGTLALGTANNRNIAVTGASDQLTVSAQLTGGTGRTLTKSGLGSLTLSADNTGFAAAISVTAGTLLVNNTAGTGTGSNTVTVGTLGTLGGSGTIAGAVTVDGALKPGNGTGLLSVGSLNLNASTSTTLEINGTNRGAVSNGYDALGVNTGGSIDLGGALSFVFGNLSAFTNGTDLDLFSFDTTSTGDFGGVTSTGFYAGTWGKTGDIWSLDSGGQTLNFSEVTGNLSLVAAIPEPNVAALLGGFSLLALLRRRR